MTFLQSIWADLVEKRLWPVLVALLIALVAVPVVLGRGGAEPVDAALLEPTGATGGLGAQALVSLDEVGATRLNRKGKLRNPFKQQTFSQAAGGAGGSASDTTFPTLSPVPTDGTADPGPTGGGGSPGGGGSSSGGGSPGGGGSSSGGGTPGGSPPADGGTPGGGSSGGDTSPQPAEPPAPALSDYVSEIRAGRSGVPRQPRTVARLTPLPTVERPFFVYLGVLTDRRTAVFLLSSDVRADGQAKCKPNESVCETIEMRAGQTAELTVTNDDATVTRYVLTVDDVRRRGSASSPARKGDVPARPNTKDAAKRSDEDLGTDRYSYDAETGLLRRVRATGLAGLNGTLPGIESGSVFDLPGAWGSQGPAAADATRQELPSSSPLG